MNASEWVSAAERVLDLPSVPSALIMLAHARRNLSPGDLRIVCDNLIGVWPDQSAN